MGCDQCQNSLCQKTVHTSHIPTYSLELGVCVLTCWKQGVCVAEMGGMCYGYVSVVEMCVVEIGGMYQLQKGGYVLWKCGYVSVAEMVGMYQLQK